MSTQIPPKSKLPKKWICIHESGHAVAAAIAATQVPGCRLLEVVADDKSGHIEVDLGFAPSAMHWRLITLLAGPRAEELIARRSSMISGWKDMDCVSDLARQIDEFEPEEIIEAYNEMATRFVDRHRKLIIRVAEALRRMGRLSGPQVAAIIWPTPRRRACGRGRSRRPRPMIRPK